MKNYEIENLLKTSKSNLVLDCCGNHAHTAVAGCMAGDPRDVAVVALAESLLNEREVLRKMTDRFQG